MLLPTLAVLLLARDGVEIPRARNAGRQPSAHHTVRLAAVAELGVGVEEGRHTATLSARTKPHCRGRNAHLLLPAGTPGSRLGPGDALDLPLSTGTYSVELLRSWDGDVIRARGVEEVLVQAVRLRRLLG